MGWEGINRRFIFRGTQRRHVFFYACCCGNLFPFCFLYLDLSLLRRDGENQHVTNGAGCWFQLRKVRFFSRAFLIGIARMFIRQDSDARYERADNPIKSAQQEHQALDERFFMEKRTRPRSSIESIQKQSSVRKRKCLQRIRSISKLEDNSRRLRKPEILNR